MKCYRLIPLFFNAAAVAAIVFVFSNAFAQTAPTISYQGLLESNGVPVSGTDTMTVSIYNVATGGYPQYTESQAVPIQNGIFNMAIGSVKSLLPALDFSKQYWLSVSVAGGPELSPRVAFGFAPYAFHALNADTASYSISSERATVATALTGGAVTSVNGSAGALTLQGANGIIISNSSGTLTISNSGVQSLNTATGKVTLAGAGGTTISQNGSQITITSQTFSGGTGIQAVQNSDSSITILNSSGPIATISLGKQNASVGQVLAWNGSQWKPSSTGIVNTDSTISISTKSSVDTIGLATQNATSGQVLVFNGKSWRPETVSGIGADSIKNLGDARVYDSPNYSLFLGAGSGTHNTGSFNTAVGLQAMDSNTTGNENNALGFQALFANTSGYSNTAIGHQAMIYNKSGFCNTAVGVSALGDDPDLGTNSGSNNCAFGLAALALNASGSYNVAIGAEAFQGWFGSSSSNTAVGYRSMDNAATDRDVSHIVAIGDSSLSQVGYSNTSGDSATENTAIGSGALRWVDEGSYNTSTGYQSLHQNVRGYNNTADGASALWNTLGSNNTGMGANALIQNTSGNNNAAFGDNSGPTGSGLSNTVCLGSGAQATASGEVMLGNPNTTSSFYCQGAYAATTAASANMVVASNGQIMRSTSSARYKTNIHDLDINTDAIYDLRPVSYTSKIDGKQYFGLVAEDVAKVVPDLAEYARAKDVIPGSTSDNMIPDAVKYPMLSVLLLQELKKEHAKVDDLERRIEALEAAQKSAGNK